MAINTLTAKKSMTDPNQYLTNQFVIAMPALTDPYFAHAVVYICEHNENGAIGIVINQPLELHLSDVLTQMEITNINPTVENFSVLCGGPVHPERGFVIHTPGGQWRSTLDMTSEISVTTSRDILEAIAQNVGPQDAIISLGYASWTAGQLEQEIISNFWLTCPAEKHILFKLPFGRRWNAAMEYLGIDVNKLSSDIGHA